MAMEKFLGLYVACEMTELDIIIKHTLCIRSHTYIRVSK